MLATDWEASRAKFQSAAPFASPQLSHQTDLALPPWDELLLRSRVRRTDWRSVPDVAAAAVAAAAGEAERARRPEAEALEAGGGR